MITQLIKLLKFVEKNAEKDCPEVNSKTKLNLNDDLKESHGKYILQMNDDNSSDSYGLDKKDYLGKNPDIKLVGTNAITIN
jgi:hypothetical protein